MCIGLFDNAINCGTVRPYNYYVFQEATINFVKLVTDLIFVMTNLVRMLHTVDVVMKLYAILCIYYDNSLGNQIAFCKKSCIQYAVKFVNVVTVPTLLVIIQRLI